MLIKNSLERDVLGVDCAASDHIVLRLKSLPNLSIICCYVAPSDSPYATNDCLARVSGELNGNPESSIILIGDMNCHFGNLRNSFLETAPAEADWAYVNICDADKPPNQNARLVLTALSQMVPVNGLKTETTQYPSKFTYRQGQKWISELDFCFVTPDLVGSVDTFDIDNAQTLPSDHAPISVSFSLRKD